MIASAKKIDRGRRLFYSFCAVLGLLIALLVLFQMAGVDGPKSTTIEEVRESRAEASTALQTSTFRDDTGVETEHLDSVSISSRPTEDMSEKADIVDVDRLFTGPVTYELLKEAITDGAMPELYRRLSDTKHWKDRPKILHLIAFYGPSDQSTDAIISYIASNEHPNPVTNDYMLSFITNRINAAQILGFTKGEQAERFLTNLLEEGGAEELVPLWIKVHPRLSELEREEILVAALRARATVGLGILGDTLHRGLVHKIYQDLDDELRVRAIRRLEPHEFQGDQGPGREKEILYSGAVEGLAYYDWIRDEGIQAYWKGRLKVDGAKPVNLSEYKRLYRFDHWEYVFAPAQSQ